MWVDDGGVEVDDRGGDFGTARDEVGEAGVGEGAVEGLGNAGSTG